MKVCLLDDSVGRGEVQPDTAAFSADKDDSGPVYLAERDERCVARLTPHLPIVPQKLDTTMPHQHRLY